jgi:hypothetical protein
MRGRPVAEKCMWSRGRAGDDIKHTKKKQMTRLMFTERMRNSTRHMAEIKKSRK